MMTVVVAVVAVVMIIKGTFLEHVLLSKHIVKVKSHAKDFTCILSFNLLNNLKR